MGHTMFVYDRLCLLPRFDVKRALNSRQVSCRRQHGRFNYDHRIPDLNICDPRKKELPFDVMFACFITKHLTEHL